MALRASDLRSKTISADPSERGGCRGAVQLGGGDLDLHGSPVERDSVVLLHGLEGVRSPVENDLCCAERPSAPVVVDRRSFQLAELGEELLDVRVGDAEVEVGDDELGGTATASRDPTRPPSATTVTA